VWHYCEVCRKTIFKPVLGSGTIISQREQLHKESILKETGTASVQVCKFYLHRANPRIKLSDLMLKIRYARHKHLISLMPHD
jgi:hypothetical protein